MSTNKAEVALLRLPLPKTPSLRDKKCLWLGSVSSWPEGGPPLLDFGRRVGGKKTDRRVELISRPGELLLWAWIGRHGHERRCFALAWRREDGTLAPQRLPSEEDALDVFQAGGHAEPADDVPQVLEALAVLQGTECVESSFRRLCAVIGDFMEAHLLLGAPVATGEAPGELAHRTRGILQRHAEAWPEFAGVLTAAAAVFGRYENGSLSHESAPPG